jgi:hypothetical protein
VATTDEDCGEASEAGAGEARILSLFRRKSSLFPSRNFPVLAIRPACCPSRSGGGVRVPQPSRVAPATLGRRRLLRIQATLLLRAAARALTILHKSVTSACEKILAKHQMPCYICSLRKGGECPPGRQVMLRAEQLFLPLVRSNILKTLKTAMG